MPCAGCVTTSSASRTGWTPTGPSPLSSEMLWAARTRVSGMDKHILLVHAHPDDESIGQGATMAKYVAEGIGVTLVTCTGGEMGGNLGPEKEHTSADPDGTPAEQPRAERDKAPEKRGRT